MYLAWICDMRQRRTTPGGFIRGKTSSAISATLTFLVFFYSTTLLTSYFYPVGLGADRILIPDWRIFSNAGYGQLGKKRSRFAETTVQKKKNPTFSPFPEEKKLSPRSIFR